MLKIALTGNIACGKSSISKELKNYGISIIDADIISRQIYEYEDMVKTIEKNFPTAVKDNKVDRKELGSIVFSDKEKLKLLNSLTHEKIKEIVKKHLKECEERKQIGLVDAALLYEAGFDTMVDRVILVYCDLEEEVRRVMSRDGLSKEEAMKRINSQMSQAEKLKRADYVVDNSGDLEELNKNIKKLLTVIDDWKKH